MIGALLAILVGLMLWLVTRATRVSPSITAAATQEVQLEAKSQRPSGEAPATSGGEHGRDLAPAPAPSAPARAASTNSGPFEPDRLDERQGLDRSRERQELSSRWSAETPDSPWTSESAERISHLLSEHGFSAGALRDLDCRQTICRFLLIAQSDRDLEVSGLIGSARALELETWLMPSRETGAHAGSWAVEVYFPRKGYRLSGGGGRIGELPDIANQIASDEQNANHGTEQ